MTKANLLCKLGLKLLVILLAFKFLSLNSLVIAEDSTEDKNLLLLSQPAKNQSTHNCTGSISGRVFKLEIAPEFITSEWPGLTSIGKKRVAAGDFNGDGFDDLILPSDQTNSIVLALSNGKDRFNQQIWSIREANANSFYLLYMSYKVGHLNEDQCADIVLYDQFKNLKVALSNCRDSFDIKENIPKPQNAVMNIINAGDLDGDGKAEIITIDNKFQIAYISSVADNGNHSEIWYNRFDNRFDLSGAHDFDGNGKADLIGVDESSRIWYLNIIGKDGYFFASLPPYFRWQHTFGDFNGDGRTDILVKGDGLAGWWIIASNGTYGIEKSIPNIFPSEAEIGDIIAADFNGDGLSDVVAQNEKTGKPLLAIAKPPPGFGHASISVNSQLLITTKENGSYSLGLAVEKESNLVPLSNNIHFVPSTKTVRLRCGQSKIINFAGIDSIENSEYVGQAVTLGGDHPGPYICLSYTFDVPPWGINSKWDMTKRNCPEGYAFYNIDSSIGKLFPKQPRCFSGNCCRLPHPDILTEEHGFFSAECPDDYVATGAYCSENYPYHRQGLRCTKVNTKRYQLGEFKAGKYWGVSLAMRLERNRIRKDSIPLAIRYGLGRYDYNYWNNNGCVGFPWGSLLAKITGRRCYTNMFRQLLYRGLPGDPPAGTPVEMFPNCKEIKSIHDPTSGCKIKEHNFLAQVQKTVK